MFETFVRKIIKAVDELEKRGRGMHNADIVEIIWQRVSNAELSQYLTALKVQFQHQPRNYREVLQDIASKVLSIGNTFLSNNRNSSTTAEDISYRWGLSISQASLTLNATTQKLTISAILPLARRYRADRMFDVRGIHGIMSTDTMDTRSQSIHNEKYCQLCGNKKFFVEEYPIKKKSDCRLVLDKFVKEYVATGKMTYDGVQERIRRKTEFQRVMKNMKSKGTSLK